MKNGNANVRVRMPGVTRAFRQQPRASIKQRGGRAQQENTRPSNQQQEKKKQIIGASGLSLSARFSKLHDEPLKKKQVVVNVKTKKQGKQPPQQQKQQKQQRKLQQVAQANKAKRQQVTNQRRKGLKQVPQQPSNQQKPKPQKKTPVTKNNAKPAPGNRKKEAVAKKPVSSDDLDVEMDAYWHEAGKGPDPKQAQLDRQMDEYWAAKPPADTKQEDTKDSEETMAPDDNDAVSS